MDMIHDNLPTPKGDGLTYIRRGVLYVQKKPHYIVELIKEDTASYVMVYAVHPPNDTNDKQEKPKKLAREVTKKQNVFSKNTLLGQLANRMIPAKSTSRWIPNGPLFIAPVIPNQVATLTGKVEEGFFEREPDREAVLGGERKMVRGEATGVFVGLSSIVWEDKVTIPTESLIKALTEYKQDMFYDLEGDNNNQDNPLSTYYQGRT